MIYISENCIENLNLEGVYIQNVNVINNQLHLNFEYIEVMPEHSLNPSNDILSTNEAKLIFHDFEVQECGFYDSSTFSKILEDGIFNPLKVYKLLNNFSLISSYSREKTNKYFNHYIAGFANDFEEKWGTCTIRYIRMEACWNSFYSREQ